MGNVNYELPDHLGTLSLTIPAHWTGARAEGVDAVWIDQTSDGFKNNITLKIRRLEKTSNSEQLLDAYVAKFLENTGLDLEGEVQNKPGRRSLSVHNQIQGITLTQDEFILYAESASHSYLLTLTSSYPKDGDGPDLSVTELVPEQ